MGRVPRNTAPPSGSRNVDAQRKLMDELMGLNRNGDRPDDVISVSLYCRKPSILNCFAQDYKDDRVCKAHLVGACTTELFTNTKMDFGGACAKKHDDIMKKAYVLLYFF